MSYQEAKAKAPKISETGVIEYGIRNASWTLTEIDEKLFYCYYGISAYMEK